MKQGKITNYFNLTKIIRKYSSVDLILKNSKLNIYNGIEFDLDSVIINENTQNISNFSQVLGHSLEEWEKMSIRSITVKVPSNLTDYIKFFIQKEFYIHHTSDNNIYLCKWLDKNCKDMIPRFAHHHVGIGACIINKNLDFLLIKEKYRPNYVNKTPKKLLWKFVTGLIEQGESLVDATVREAKEEVKLDVNYEGCILYSESYPNNLNISDICFFSLCTLKNEEEIDYINIQIEKDELTEAKFFKLKEVENLLREKETTILTKQTFSKLIPMINFENSLEENIEKLKSKGLFFASNIDLKELNYKINYLNVYK